MQVRLLQPEVWIGFIDSHLINFVLKIGEKHRRFNMGKIFARKLQHADFSWESHLSHQLDHALDSGCDFGDPRKPILARFG